MPLYINGELIEGIGFMWDDCHKFYLIRDDGDLSDMASVGWDVSKLLPLSQLPEMWGKQCGLGFISSGDLSEQFVEQFDDDVTVEYR